MERLRDLASERDGVIFAHTQQAWATEMPEEQNSDVNQAHAVDQHGSQLVQQERNSELSQAQTVQQRESQLEQQERNSALNQERDDFEICLIKQCSAKLDQSKVIGKQDKKQHRNQQSISRIMDEGDPPRKKMCPTKPAPSKIGGFIASDIFSDDEREEESDQNSPEIGEAKRKRNKRENVSKKNEEKNEENISEPPKEDYLSTDVENKVLLSKFVRHTQELSQFKLHNANRTGDQLNEPIDDADDVASLSVLLNDSVQESVVSEEVTPRKVSNLIERRLAKRVKKCATKTGVKRDNAGQCAKGKNCETDARETMRDMRHDKALVNDKKFVTPNEKPDDDIDIYLSQVNSQSECSIQSPLTNRSKPTISRKTLSKLSKFACSSGNDRTSNVNRDSDNVNLDSDNVNLDSDNVNRDSSNVTSNVKSSDLSMKSSYKKPNVNSQIFSAPDCGLKDEDFELDW